MLTLLGIPGAGRFIPYTPILSNSIGNPNATLLLCNLLVWAPLSSNPDDIHTLFDLHLMSINPATLRVELSPKLTGSPYTDLEGGKLRERINGSEVNESYLSEHIGKLRQAGS